MRVINDYRDSRREGIVRSRNRLFATGLFAGFTAYAVLALALVEEVARRWIAAGVAYYLVGAVIGLFQQLRAASAADTVTEEDYGLATARCEARSAAGSASSSEWRAATTRPRPSGWRAGSRACGSSRTTRAASTAASWTWAAPPSS